MPNANKVAIGNHIRQVCKWVGFQKYLEEYTACEKQSDKRSLSILSVTDVI